MVSDTELSRISELTDSILERDRKAKAKEAETKKALKAQRERMLAEKKAIVYDGLASGKDPEEVLQSVADDLCKEALASKSKVDVMNYYSDLIVNSRMFFKCGGDFYKYNGTYYEPTDELTFEQYINSATGRSLNSTQRTELKRTCEMNDEFVISPSKLDTDPHLLMTKNGLLNLRTGMIETGGTNRYDTLCINIAYDPDPPHSPRIDEFMNYLCCDKNADGQWIVNLDKKTFLYEIIGYILLKSLDLDKMFYFVGKPGCGKSTLQELILGIIGRDLSVNLPLEKMEQDYFAATAFRKLLAYDPDSGNRKIKNAGCLLPFISGESMTARQIYKEPITFKNYATYIVNSNYAPNIADMGGGLSRRLAVIKFDHVFTDDVKDPFFMDKITEQDLQYLLYKAVCAIGIVLRQKKFTKITIDERMTDTVSLHQSSTMYWLFNTKKCIADIHLMNVQTIYTEYADWAKYAGYGDKPEFMVEFESNLCREFDLVTNDRRQFICEWIDNLSSKEQYEPLSETYLKLRRKRSAS